MATAAPSGRCIFCDQPGLTKEHLGPDWLKRFLPRRATDHFHTTGSSTIVGDRVFAREPDLKRQAGDIRSRRLKVVCGQVEVGVVMGIRVGMSTLCQETTSARILGHLVGKPERPRFRGTGFMECGRLSPPQSALTPANFTTFPHFSVSSTMSLPKSAGEPVSAVPPRSASLALILGSARAALISLLSLSMISAGVAFGAPTPYQLLAS